MFVVLCIYIVCVACVVLSFELVCGGCLRLLFLLALRVLRFVYVSRVSFSFVAIAL